MSHVNLEILDKIQLGQMSAKVALVEVEKEILEKLMLNKRYNQSRAAKELGVTRQTLRRLLVKHFGDKYVGTRGHQ